jgi:DNA integrity scanning protein DisA with diadenylate cyclase activity
MSEGDAKKVTETVLQHAQQMARGCGARAIVVCADAFASPTEVESHLPRDPELKTLLVTRDPKPFREALDDSFEVIEVPNVKLTRMGQIKMGILLGLSRGTLRQGDSLICLSGIAGSGELDTILFTVVGEEFEMFPATGGEELRRHTNPEVFEKVLDISVALGQEGRQGKPVGTIFVIGDIERVQEFSEPLMLNPFQGHPEEQRNILDPSLRETIKELSALDGAFLIRDDGVVEAAGVFLRSVIAGSILPRGLGARHRSAAAITAATKATTITVSESTGAVTVFRDGKIIIEIEKPRTVASTESEAKGVFRKGDTADAEEQPPRPGRKKRRGNDTSTGTP